MQAILSVNVNLTHRRNVHSHKVWTVIPSRWALAEVHCRVSEADIVLGRFWRPKSNFNCVQYPGRYLNFRCGQTSMMPLWIIGALSQYNCWPVVIRHCIDRCNKAWKYFFSDRYKMNFMVEPAHDVGYSMYNSPLASYLPVNSVNHSHWSRGSFCPQVVNKF